MDAYVLLFFAVEAAMIFGIVYVVVTARHRQRMAMIEKGADPSLFASKSNGSLALALGLLLAGLGVGLGVGWFADHVIIHDPENDNPLPYFISVLICGGLALLQYHKIVRRKQQG
jgi:hypothetical protein